MDRFGEFPNPATSVFQRIDTTLRISLKRMRGVLYDKSNYITL
jgi:hypothetical protein